MPPCYGLSMIRAFWDNFRILQLARPALLVFCACTSVLAAARSDPATDATYARFSAIAGEPQDSVRFFRIHHWQPLSERALVLWLGREEPYLIDLRERCHDLKRELSLRIADYQRPGRNMLRARWSSIFTRDGQDCRIASIRALDFSRIHEINPRELGTGEAARTGTENDQASTARRWAALVSVHMEPPDYPRNDAGRNKHGVVHVAAEVLPDGRVRKTEILDSSGHVDLDHAALDAVRQWRFEPYRNDDQALPVWVRVPVVFADDSGR